jgi:hypothetical protein
VGGVSSPRIESKTRTFWNTVTLPLGCCADDDSAETDATATSSAHAGLIDFVITR